MAQLFIGCMSLAREGFFIEFYYSDIAIVSGIKAAVYGRILA